MPGLYLNEIAECGPVDRVAQQLEMERDNVLAPGKYPQNVRARSLLCYWGTGELGMTTVEPAWKLNLAQPSVSQAAVRGRKIAHDEGFCLIVE